VDLDIEVRLDDHAFDEEADQTLTRVEVGAVQAVLDLANEVRQLAPYRAPCLVIVKSRSGLLKRIRQQSIPSVDLLSTPQQILHVDGFPLIRIEKSLHLTVACLHLTDEVLHLVVQRLRRRRIEPGMPGDTRRIRHELSQVVPHHLLEYARLDRFERARA
jgi:hypothetical protein